MPTQTFTAVNTQNPGMPGVDETYTLEMDYVEGRFLWWRWKTFTKYRWYDSSGAHLSEGKIEGKLPRFELGSCQLLWNKEKARFEFLDGPGGSQGHLD